jgi:hypothetical protein
MKKFLHSHTTIIIGTLAVVFIVVLVSFYSWAIDDVFRQIDRALTSPSTQNAVGFDIPGASKLNLRGLVNGATPTATSTPTATTSTPVATSSTQTP